MKKLSKIVLASLVAVFMALAFVPASSVLAQQMTVGGGAEAARGEDTPETLFGDGGIFTTIVNVILFLVGVISVIMLVYGGIRYATSAGDSGRVTSAKNTVLYAIVGLIVAILAFAIVNFVITGLID